MRPTRVEISGFSAFRDRTEIDFDGTDLLALVGPTGSGKSSIIDAIVFALYGSVSRYGDERLVEPVIHKLCNEARVRADFELNGVHYVAVRVVRRKPGGGAVTKEARLVRVASDGTEEVLAGTVREMGPAVNKVIGLTFEQFTRTVVLPQGDFAKFLHGEKADRQQLLRQLLDTAVYARMGTIARNRAKEAITRMNVLGEQRAKLTVPSDEEVAGREARRTAVEEAQRVAAAHLAQLKDRTQRLESLHAVAAGLARVDGVLEALEVPPAVADAGERLAAAVASVRNANDALDSARAARDAAQAAVEGAAEPADLKRRIDAARRAAELETTIADLDQQLAMATDAQTTAEREEERLLGEAEAAQGRFQEAQTAAGFGAAIASLGVGEPCPVCRQIVTELPDHDVDAELAAAKKAVTAADKAAKQARRATDDARKTTMAVTTKLQSLRNERAGLESDVDVEQLEAQLAVALELKRVLDDAMSAVRSAEQVAKETGIAVAGLEAEERELRDGFTKARDGVAERTPPPPGGGTLLDDWRSLVAWAATEREVIRGELDETEGSIGVAAREVQELSVAVVTTCRAAGVETVIEKAEADLARAEAELDHWLADARRVREDAASLDLQIDTLRVSSAVDAELGRLLEASGFERWLLQSAFDDLVSRATVRLFDLSGGQFSLESSDGDFSIRDHRNADEIRSVRTLSGGETFLTSLSLALALSESIRELAVEGAPRIESMFLDEGFGTLDPESLDLVATALAELSAGGRLIAVVTHIRDLADQMPVRIEVRKGTTSSTVERVEV